MGLDVAHRTQGIDWTGIDPRVRAKFEGHVSAVCRSEAECQDLGYFFLGDLEFCPYLPILLAIPGTPSATIVIGDGVTTVSELRDLCVTSWGRMLDRLHTNGGRIFDFDALREKAGLPRREEADAIVRTAMWERAQEHKRNPITDPSRDPMSEQNPRKSFPTTPMEQGDAAWPL